MCEASEYSNCNGYIHERDVNFLYRDNKGNREADKTVKVSLCTFHCEWLESHYNVVRNKPLEMRGEQEKYALHDDLFLPFAKETTFYTLIKIVRINAEKDCEDDYCWIHGRDVSGFNEHIMTHQDIRRKMPRLQNATFETIMKEGCTIISLTEVAIIGLTDEGVSEMKQVTYPTALETIVDDLSTCYKPINPEGEVGSYAITLEKIPQVVREFYSLKKYEQDFDMFEECLSFINDEIGEELLNFHDLREKSCVTNIGLFIQVQALKNALIHRDEESIKKLKDNGDIKPDVLWVTYILENHQLYWTFNKKKSLRNSALLVDLFVEQNLHENLLLIAISGERLRTCSIKQKDHHNILSDNIFVVKQLVPKHIKGRDELRFNEKKMNALEYYCEFSNKMYSISPFVEEEYFDKNENIREYLEEHTKGEIDPYALTNFELSILQDILNNGHSAAEFIIGGFPGLFITMPIIKDGNVVKVTAEYQEKYMPTMHNMYDTKKKQLRKGDYFTWKLVNNEIRDRDCIKNKYKIR